MKLRLALPLFGPPSATRRQDGIQGYPRHASARIDWLRLPSCFNLVAGSSLTTTYLTTYPRPTQSTDKARRWALEDRLTTTCRESETLALARPQSYYPSIAVLAMRSALTGIACERPFRSHLGTVQHAATLGTYACRLDSVWCITRSTG